MPRKSRAKRRQKSIWQNPTVIVGIFGAIATILAAFILNIQNLLPKETLLATKSTTNTASSAVALVPTTTETFMPISPITLTPDSSVLFEEDFDDEEANGFSPGINMRELWSIVEDGSNNKVLQVDNSTGTSFPDVRFGPPSFSNGIIEFRIKFIYFDLETNDDTGHFDFHFRIGDSDETGYVVIIDPHFNNAKLVYDREGNAEWITLGRITKVFDKNTWYSVRVIIQRDEFSVFLDDALIIEARDSNLQTGKLIFAVAPKTIVQLDDVRILSSESP